MKYANLHLHSVHSDGVYTPRELCEMAKKMGYGGIALTDHDTVSGCADMKKAAEETGLEYIFGIETYGVEFGIKFHITGYDFDPTEKAMAEYLRTDSESAYIVTKGKFDAMVAAGYITDITWQDVLDDSPKEAWFCNEQIFASLVKRTELTQKDYWDFVGKFRSIKTDVKPTFTAYSAEKMIKTITGAGGVAILAHPNRWIPYLPELYKMGIRGVEYDHPDVCPESCRAAYEFAKEHNMYLSGGTDHTGRLANFPWERGDTPGAKERAGDAYHCPLDTDVYSGITKEEFDALKNRIYG